jgi:hypothetical protein
MTVICEVISLLSSLPSSPPPLLCLAMASPHRTAADLVVLLVLSAQDSPFDRFSLHRKANNARVSE